MKRNLPFVLFNRFAIIRKTAFLILCLLTGLTISAQKPLTAVHDNWKNGVWESSSRETMTYDGSGYLLSVLFDDWDPTLLEWVTQARANYTNNTNGTPSVILTQSLVETVWIDFSRTTLTYNGSGKMLTAVNEYSLGGPWINLSRMQNTYDGNGFLTNTLFQDWDVVSSNWKNSSQHNFTNNTNGDPSEEIVQLWQTNVWVNSTRTTFAYNVNGDVSQEILYQWISGSWQVDTRDSYTYDGNKFLTRLVGEKWDVNTQAWGNNMQTNYTNNNSGEPLVEITQKWDGIGTWVNYTRDTYTYGTPTLVREYSAERKFTVYPNPSADIIKIRSEAQLDGSSYSITDQTGKPVLRGILYGNEEPEIDISTLSNGVYFLKIGQDSREAYKILKNKPR